MKIPFIYSVCLIFLFCFPLVAQSDDDIAVLEIVGQINDAFRDRNIEKFSRILGLDAKWNENWRNDFQKGEYAQFPIKSYTIRSVKIEGETAAVRVFWERIDAKTGQNLIEYGRNHRIFYLKKIESVWKYNGFITAENDLISQILRAETDEERKNLFRAETELNTHQMIYVIIFRFRNEGNFAEVAHYLQLVEWFGEEFYKNKDEHKYVNNQVNILNARAANERTLGNNSEAMRFYLEAARFSEEIGAKTGRPIGGAFLTLLNIGTLYFSQGNLDQADRFALSALDGLAGVPRERHPVVFASLYNLLGDIHFQRGETEKALEFYQKNGELSSQGIGEVYLRQKKLAEALNIFQAEVGATEREILQKGKPNLPGAVKAHSKISEIYLRQGNPEKALQEARRAVEYAEQTKNPELIFLARTAEGKAFLAKNQFSDAERSFRAAIETVETGRQNVVGGEESRISFFENRVEPYQKMVELNVKSGDAKTALEFSERGKSRVLNEILQIGRVDWRSVLNNADKMKEQTLRDKMTELNRLQTALRYQPEVDKTRLDEVTKHLEKVRLDYEFLQTSAFANYAELRRSRGITTNIKADEIASMIRQPNEALLEFTVSDEQIFLFVATKEKSGKLNLQVYQLAGKSSEIIDLASGFRRLIVERNLDYKESAQKLYDILFQKAAAQLTGKTNWIIVPDGELWNVPFAALVASNNRFLIENNVLNFVQSLTALKELNSIKTAQTSGSLLAVGNPRLDEKTVSLVRAQYRSDIGDLPEAETEVLSLQKIYGKSSKILTKSEAREGVWKTEAGKYRFLHLATHGLANSIKPLYSHLFLSTDSSQLQEDGLLEAWEVMNLRLNADFTILSACETMRGSTNKGEGIIGLSWVFAVANVPRVVASQWKVESVSTSELMTEFHHNLISNPNKSVAKALQTAMIKQLKKPEFRHPFYWAGFISIGKN